MAQEELPGFEEQEDATAALLETTIKEVEDIIPVESTKEDIIVSFKFELTGTTEQIEEICKRKIEIGAPSGGFVLSTGAAVYGPDRSIDTIINASKKYGRYPIKT